MSTLLTTFFIGFFSSWLFVMPIWYVRICKQALNEGSK